MLTTTCTAGRNITGYAQRTVKARARICSETGHGRRVYGHRQVNGVLVGVREGLGYENRI